MSNQLHYHIIDNFFGNQIHALLPYLKAQMHFSVNDHPDPAGQWPGERGSDIFEHNPPLACLFTRCMGEHMPVLNEGCMIRLYTHFRYNDSPDWIHRDSNKVTAIVYLSETNLDSGTCFYDAEKDGNLMLEVPFVQNRAIIFHGDVWHTSKLNYGTTSDDARFTMKFLFDV